MKTSILSLIIWLLTFTQLQGQIFIEGGINHCDIQRNLDFPSKIFRPEFGLGYEMPLELHKNLLWNSTINYYQYYSKRKFYEFPYGYNAEFIILKSGLMLRTVREANPKFIMVISPVLAYKYRVTMSLQDPENAGKEVKVKIDPGNSNSSDWNYGFNFEIGTEVEWKNQRLSLRFQVLPLFLPEFKTDPDFISTGRIFWLGLKLVYTPRIKKSYDRSISQ